MKFISITSIFGGCDILFKTLLLFIVLDYITGILKAIYQKKLNSDISSKGIIKKFGYIFIVILAATLDTLINDNYHIRQMIVYMFIANEGISIIENWASMGIKIPNIIKEKFADIGGENNESNNQSNL